MRVANCVVGHLQVLEYVHLTAGPDAAIAVLVAGEILEDRLHLRAVRVSGIGLGSKTADVEMVIWGEVICLEINPADVEMVIGGDAAVPHETVKVRMGGVALELLHLGSTWKGL